MPIRRQNLAQPRKTYGTCRALPETPHTATHKSGYCDLHHREYQRAMKRLASAKYNHRVGRSPNPAPDRATFLASVSFTPIEGIAAVLDERTKSIISGACHDLDRCAAMLQKTPLQLEALMAAISRLRSELAPLANLDRRANP